MGQTCTRKLMPLKDLFQFLCWHFRLTFITLTQNFWFRDYPLEGSKVCQLLVVDTVGTFIPKNYFIYIHH